MLSVEGAQVRMRWAVISLCTESQCQLLLLSACPRLGVGRPSFPDQLLAMSLTFWLSARCSMATGSQNSHKQ